jgi:AraC-like DNA-binding protein
MNLDSIIIKSLTVIKYKTKPIYFDVAPRDHHTLSYRILGENEITGGSSKLTSDKGSLTFVPMGIPYKHRVVTASEQIAALFITQENIGDDIKVFTLPPRCSVEELFFQLYEQWEITPQENNIQCMAIFYHILALIEQENSQKNNAKSYLLADSVSYMHMHYCDNDFKIDDLYKAANLSAAYYRRVFRSIYKQSPVEYLSNLRISHAKQLLSSGYHTVAEVAKLSGFSSAAYFCTKFKSATGRGPSEFRGLSENAKSGGRS